MGSLVDKEGAHPNRPGKRIVFLAVNSSYSHSSLAAWCLRSMTGDGMGEWHTVEATINDDPMAVLNRIVRLQPDVLAATLYLFNRRYVISLLGRCRRLMPACRVLVGGPECLGDNRALLLEEHAADAAIRGEGEQAFVQWLAAVETPREWAAIPGFCGVIDGVYRDNGVAEAVPDLDDIPSFYGRELERFKRPFVQMESSRGCSNHCLFCTSRESAVRDHSLARVRADLTRIRDAGIREVRVVDRTFNERHARSQTLIRLFRDEFPELRFHLEIDPARVSDAMVRELVEAGPHRFHLEAGVQSLSAEVHRQIGRAATATATLKGLQRLCAVPSLAVHVDLIAGLPGGTLSDVREDVRSLVLLGPGEIQLERLKLLPGTPLAQDPERWGLLAAGDPPYEILQTPTMTFDDLCRSDRIAKMLDWFHNVASLRETFTDGVRALGGFLDGFEAFLAERTDFLIRPSLEQRFRWLDRFLSSHDAGLVLGLRYKWFQLGFSPGHGLCPAEPWKGPIPDSAVLLEGDASKTFSRKWRVDLGTPHLFCYGTGEKGERAVLAVFRLSG